MTDAKQFEKHINEYLAKLIYATLGDLDEINGGSTKFSPLLYQSYQNLAKAKADRLTGLKNRFTIGEPVKQFLCTMFKCAVDELLDLELSNSDSAADIAQKSIDLNDECFTSFMLKYNDSSRFGQNLTAATDPSGWVDGWIAGKLVAHKATASVAVSIISNGFNTFLKYMAHKLAIMMWRTKSGLSGDLFLGTLEQHDMGKEMVDTLCENLREKAPRKKKGEAPADPVEALDAPISDALDGLLGI